MNSILWLYHLPSTSRNIKIAHTSMRYKRVNRSDQRNPRQPVRKLAGCHITGKTANLLSLLKCTRNQAPVLWTNKFALSKYVNLNSKTKQNKKPWTTVHREDSNWFLWWKQALTTPFSQWIEGVGSACIFCATDSGWLGVVDLLSGAEVQTARIRRPKRQQFKVGTISSGLFNTQSFVQSISSVSYTHLTLPTRRTV